MTPDRAQGRLCVSRFWAPRYDRDGRLGSTAENLRALHRRDGRTPRPAARFFSTPVRASDAVMRWSASYAAGTGLAGISSGRLGSTAETREVASARREDFSTRRPFPSPTAPSDALMRRQFPELQGGNQISAARLSEPSLPTIGTLSLRKPQVRLVMRPGSGQSLPEPRPLWISPRTICFFQALNRSFPSSSLLRCWNSISSCSCVFRCSSTATRITRPTVRWVPGNQE
jgi:hypothetical protein